MSSLSTEDVVVLPCPQGSHDPQGPQRPDGPGLPTLRLLPAPSCEPPYDDELAPAPDLRLLPSPQQQALPLVLTRPVPVLRPGPSVRVVARPGDADPDALEVAADAAARRTALSALPSPRRFAHALVQQLLEVQAGVRPLPQLQRQVSFDLYDVLSSRHRALRPVGTRPALTAVRSVHTQSRPEGVVEACASVESDGRLVAVALRLEGKDGAWRCTHLEGL